MHSHFVPGFPFAFSLWTQRFRVHSHMPPGIFAISHGLEQRPVSGLKMMLICAASLGLVDLATALRRGTFALFLGQFENLEMAPRSLDSLAA